MTVTTDAPTTPTPGWWSITPPGWLHASAATLADWQQHQPAKVKKLDREVALAALEFGYGARAAYGEHTAWKGLVSQLERDWQEAGHEHLWKHVHGAVKAGWTAAGGHREEAPAESIGAWPARSAHEPVPVPVPGGRPDHPSIAPAAAEGVHDPEEHPVSGGRPT